MSAPVIKTVEPPFASTAPPSPWPEPAAATVCVVNINLSTFSTLANEPVDVSEPLIFVLSEPPVIVNLSLSVDPV